MQPVVRHVASFSGGKDSTAMVLRLIDEGRPLDEIVFFDTGWEFPQMYDHIAKFEAFTGRTVTRLHPREPFDHKMCTKPIVRKKKSDPMHGQVYRFGNGWPSFACRWCTREKVDVIDAHCGDALRYVGIAADEPERIKMRNYPLVEWGMTEADCLKMCFDLGFDWGGLYDHFDRVSCFCCSLKSLDDYRTLRRDFPPLWARMIEMGDNVRSAEGRRFHHGKTVRELEARFAQEDEAEARQGRLGLCMANAGLQRQEPRQ
jgi:3'-phosphoadenosine 5'-phosphosulfate sulfotransferase (PAPS reductase)/FAD synthetase